MKVLITADLHANLAWFNWLTSQAPGYDLVVVAGDLMRTGMEGKGPNKALIDHSLQIGPLKRWADDYFAKTRTPIAISTGNHDIGHPATEDQDAWIAGEPLWEHLYTLRPQFILDDDTRLVGSLVVTITPFHWEADTPRTIRAFHAIVKGEALVNSARPRPQWLLVHHRPPAGVLASSDPIFFDEGLPLWLARHPIDFVACGHEHDVAHLSGRHVERIHNSWCINTGQEDPAGDAPIPNYAVLDTDLRTLAVIASGGIDKTVYMLPAEAPK